MSRLGRLAQVVLHVEDSPTRVALAFALGAFISFFPILGIHTGLALVLAFTFRLNRPAILAGAWINNPWTLAPMFTAGTLVGCWLLGVSPASLADVDWKLHGRAFYESLYAGLRPLVLPFVVGNLALGAVAFAVSFVGVRAVLVRRRARADARSPGRG